MAGGDERTPARSSLGRKARLPRSTVQESSLDCQKDSPCLSSPSVSSDKSLLQMVTPVQPPKSIDSPLQRVTPVQLSKSLDSMSILCGSGSVGSVSGAATFDICRGDSKCSIKLNRSLLEINREKRRERELSKDVPFLHLRSGMVLLKKFLKPEDQAEIIKVCQKLGVGAGGFYIPGYGDEAQLNLRMMCLGKNWDPNSSLYGDIRPSDGAKPPSIPEKFKKLVKDAIEASHDFLEKRGGTSNPLVELPIMSPDICIVNFYTNSGRLGLHQDKDESKASLAEQLPVVSFSLGDTAEFLYGDARDDKRLAFQPAISGSKRDDGKLSKVDLESGDVLIFGGQSRRIFHGVPSIKPNTAPTWLTNETRLRPGRLNLTFRQY